MGRDFAVGGAGGSGDEQKAPKSEMGDKSYNCLSAKQIQGLEAFFKECPNPNENQRRQLGRDLELDPQQITLWFHNKKSRMEAQNKRADNTILWDENERIRTGNLEIIDALKNVICQSIGARQFREEENKQTQQRLQLENIQLKEEHEILSNLLARYSSKPQASANGFSLDLLPGGSLNNEIRSPVLDHDFGSFPARSDNSMIPHQMGGITDMEKTIMLKTATSAMEELVKLLRINEPLWVKSAADGRFFLNCDIYGKLFPTINHIKSSSAHVESSKDSRIVSMSRAQLIDIFLDSDKWVDIFPTILTKAKTIKVLESGLGNRKGALQLMYEQMHNLSPLVPPREFIFLRHCEEVEPRIWVIVDVSFDYLKVRTSHPLSWKRPSGCVIRELPNGFSEVTWVEHVEVDVKTQTHSLYRDIIRSSVLYGAERWVEILQITCERFAYPFSESVPSHEAEGVFSSPEGRRSTMKLAHRMVKSFCGILNMSDKVDVPRLSEVNKSNSRVQVTVRQNKEPGQPVGIIVTAATSLWLPLPPHNLFDFFRDGKRRFQWDILSNGNPVSEIARISNENHLGNCTSIIRPFSPTERNLLILQETYVDRLKSLVVYAPIDLSSLRVALRGEDSSNVQILPSGFVISSDSRSNTVAGASSSQNNGRSGGSLLTAAIQILVCNSSEIEQLNMESVAEVKNLLALKVKKIKAAFHFSGSD